MSAPDEPGRSILWPATAMVMTTLAIVTSGIAIWCLRREVEPPPAPEIVEPVEDRRVLVPAQFSDLPGWERDTVSEALPALERTCGVFARRDPQDGVGPDGVGGTVAEWADLCGELATATDDESVRQLFERHLQPVQVRNHDEEIGLFTGYYEPSLRGSRARSETYSVPLYRKPSDLVTVDLADFSDRFEGSRISGRVGEGTFKPYHERGAIDDGALDGRDLELVWVDDPVDAFFLHIQGSGRVQLEDGSEMRVGYGGQNGRPYFAIGRELVDRGALTLEEVSLQSIRAWLADNPSHADDVMATNPSFVFFRELEGEGPLGTMGLALTPGRSLAIDRSLLPLGVPVWLDGSAPRVDRTGDDPLQRLLVAQDTGGAIKGPVRGDVFWGHGEDAEEVAGHMKHDGRLWLLLPRTTVDRLAEPIVP